MSRSAEDLELLQERLVVSDAPAEAPEPEVAKTVADLRPRASGDPRSVWQRDVDRVRYSREFQRLGGVTQVASPRGDHQLHDRLTHSLKVAQIGTRLAQWTPRPDEAPEPVIDVVETACLAHDLGHPPFGHVGEETIDALCVDGASAAHPSVTWAPLREGFEGNAQSLRIVTKLARRGGPSGETRLDLSLASLNAIIKYPWERYDDQRDGPHKTAHARIAKLRPKMNTTKKRGVYSTEVSIIDKIRGVEGHGASWPACCPWPSLEASFMELADDITYAVHDLFDFFRAGAVPLAAFLRGDDGEENEVREAVAEELADAAVAKIPAALAVVHRVADSVADRLGRRMSDIDNANARIAEAAISDATSSIIGWLMPQVTYVRRPTGTWNVEWSTATAREAVDVLQALTRRFVIKSPALGLLQAGQQRMLADLFVALIADTSMSKSPRLLPVEWRGRLTQAGDLFERDAELTRAVRDYVAGLSEAGATTLHALVSGHPTASPFGGTFRYGIV